jgi:hypothetical protein
MDVKPLPPELVAAYRERHKLEGRTMSDPTDDRTPTGSVNENSDAEERTDEDVSEQTAGAGGNNPARPSETGGNSIEVGDTIQDLVEIDPSQPG